MVLIAVLVLIGAVMAFSGAFAPKTPEQLAIDAIQRQTPEQKHAAIETRIQQIQDNPNMPQGMKGQAIAMLKASEQQLDHPRATQ